MTSPFDNDPELSEYERAQRHEYGKWMAAELIPHDGVPAYNPGSPVPVSNVDTHGYGRRGQVVLQHAYVAANPDDEDVKTFLDYAKDNPEHPAVVAWEAYRAEQAEKAAAARSAAPLVFGSDHVRSAAGKSTKAAVTKATATPADKG